MAKLEKSYTEIVTRLLKGKLTSYRIAKDTGIPVQTIDKYRTGKSKIENMSLDRAETLVKYAQQSHRISCGKQQWITIARSATNPEEARAFFKKYMYGWYSRESALEAFKHAILKDVQLSRSIKGEEVKLGEKPEEIIPWLAELSVDDIPER